MAAVSGPVSCLISQRLHVAELDADLVGVGVAELVEDGQGVMPGGAGGVEVTGGVLGISEVGEGGGFVVA